MSAAALSEDVLSKIFEHAHNDDPDRALSNVSRVCFTWREAARNHPRWAEKVRKEFFWPPPPKDEDYLQRGGVQALAEDGLIFSQARIRPGAARAIAQLAVTVKNPYGAEAPNFGMMDVHSDLARRACEIKRTTVHESEILETGTGSAADGDAMCLALLEDRGVMVCGYRSGRLKAYDLRTKKCIGPLLASHDYGVTCVRAQGDTLVSAGDDKMILIWQTFGADVELWRVVRSLRTVDEVRDLYLDLPNGKIYVCTQRRGLFAYDLSSPAETFDVGEGCQMMATKAHWGYQNILGRRLSLLGVRGGSAGAPILYMGQADGLTTVDAATGVRVEERPGMGFRGLAHLIEQGSVILGVGTPRATGLVALDPRLGLAAEPVARVTHGMKSGLRTIAASFHDPWLVATGGTCLVSSEGLDLAVIPPPVQLWDLRKLGDGPFAEVFGHQPRPQTFGGVEDIVITGNTIFSCGVDSTIRYIRFDELSTARATFMDLNSKADWETSAKHISTAGNGEAGSSSENKPQTRRPSKCVLS